MAKAKAKTSKQAEIIDKVKKFDPRSVMILGLIAMSFVIGMLFQKVQDLEKNSVLGATVANNATPNPALAPSAAPGVNIDSAGGVGHLPVRGDQNAKVTLIEFADFKCPFCQQFFNQTENQ